MIQPSTRWSGPVDAVWLSDGRSMRLNEPLSYRDRRGILWTAGACLVVDGASIPRVLWRAIGGRSKVDMMTEALRAIVAHQESIGGGLAIMSATHRIAQAALDVGSE